jgi:hypothetical protein
MILSSTLRRTSVARAHEDDAERAVRAALSLIDAVGRLDVKIRQTPSAARGRRQSDRRGLRTEAIGTTGVVLRGTESLLTHRWREMDSNFWFLPVWSSKARCFRAFQTNQGVGCLSSQERALSPCPEDTIEELRAYFKPSPIRPTRSRDAGAMWLRGLHHLSPPPEPAE